MSTTKNTAFLSLNKYPMVVVLLAFILASCGGSKHKNPAPPPTTQPTQLSVAPLYPINGINWNDYVSGNDWKTAPDVVCDAFNDTACMHGGELRVVVATGQSSCTGLTASDDLGAFKWVCDASTNPVRLVSTGFADGKNLADLIDFTAGSFKSNKVTVYTNGTSWNTTSSSVWWTNPVVKDPAPSSGSISLGTASTIYLVTANPAAAITFWADKIGLVIEPGVTITGPGTAVDMITTGAYAHLWLEGKIDATNDNYGVSVNGAHFSMLRNLEMDNAGAGGLNLTGAVNNTLIGVTANHNTGSGIYVYASSQNNSFMNVTANNNSGYGVNLTGSPAPVNNTFTGVKAGNNGSYGVYLNASNNKFMDVTASNNTNGVYLTSAASNNTLTDVTANTNSYGVYLNGASKNTLANVTASNDLYGVYLVGASNNALVGVTASFNSSTGVYVYNNSNYNILTGVTASSNTSTGLLMYNSSNQTLANVASSDNNLGIYLYNSSNNRFTGLLKVGTTGTYLCRVTNGTNPGLVDTTCVNDPNSNSDAALTTGITLASSFVGLVTSDDVANASDTAGAVASFPADPTAFDWVHFDNRYRGWGIDGTTHGRWTTGAGRIWDWSLLGTDAVIRAVLSLPTGNDTITHTWSDTTTTTFLRNAVEIAGDGIGNDNGLCESGETCRYTPNIGSYQGSGNSANATFTGGTLTGITLTQFATNGEAAQP